jgi:hypothetical protein
MHNAAKTCFVTHPEMEDEGDDGRALHEVHPVLRQPVEGLQEQQQHEQSHELGRKIVPGDTGKTFYSLFQCCEPGVFIPDQGTSSQIRISNKEFTKFRYF